MNSLVSIVIPTFNRCSSLKRLIASVFDSLYKEIEIIVVDDLSTDETQEYLQNLANSHENVHFCVVDKKAYVARARNIGLNLARGKYVFLIDDDNVLAPNCITQLVSVLESNSAVGMVGPVMYYYTNKEKVWWAGTFRNMTSSKTSFLFRDGNFPGSDTWPTADFPNAWMLRRTIIEEGFFFDESLVIHYEESDFAYKVKEALGFAFKVVKGATIFHDVEENAESTTRRWADYKRVFYTARNRIIFHRRYSSLGQYFLFVIFWNWLFLAYYLFFISSLSLSRNQKIRSLMSYLRGFLSGLIS